MKNNLSIDGFAYQLRPVVLDDAEFIVEMRTRDTERTRFLNPISADIEEQRRWIKAYLKRTDDYYWVIERTYSGEQEGLVGIYNISGDRQTAEWGRWILRRGSLAAPESALLMYRIGFNYLHLSTIYCLTLLGNNKVVSFHDKCQLKRSERLRHHMSIGSQSYDAIKHVCNIELWPATHAILERYAIRIADRISRFS
jgi:RimJ/RimL family protein N-acetyltransferase